MILILSDGMTPIRKKILLQSRRRTALLSARTAGGPISVRMDFSIYPTKTRILVSMVYPYTGVEDADNYDRIYQTDLAWMDGIYWI